MSPERAAAAEGGARVSLRAVTKWYVEGEVRHDVLRELDFDVEPGESVALLGRSGSGKSTLLNLIGGIDLPSEGEVRIDGIALNRLGEHERTLFRRRSLGFVFQFFNLIPTLTVEENLLLPLELQGRLTETTRATARGLLAEIGLGDRLGTFPDRLSGGEQQRVAIARALAPGPRLVLADEPTGNLDVDTGERALALLDRLVHARGATLVMATHSRVVAERADRVVTIREGHLQPVVVAAGERV